MGALGTAWRGDWSMFDGRTLRDQLDELSEALTEDVDFSWEHWLASWGICCVHKCWAEYCPLRIPGANGGCDHVEVLLREMST